MSELICVAPVGDICGEAATWEAASQRLWWVDINRFALRVLEPDGAVRSHLFDEPVVALALTDRPGTLLVALASQLILWSPATGARSPLGPPLADAPRVRFNDGRADPAGRFWIGTMGNNVGPNGEQLEVEDGLGALFRVERDGSARVVETGIGIANTVAWSPDGRTFYFGDTLRNEVRAYAFDPETGTVSQPRPHLKDFPRGVPDGSAVDSEGCLWTARWGGGCVVRTRPDGTIERVVEVPAACVTTCTFGGPDLRTLFITTASAERAPGERLAGSVFALAAPAPGLPERVFRPT